MNDTTPQLRRSRKRLTAIAGTALIASLLISAAPAAVSAAPRPEPGSVNTADLIELRRDPQAAVPFVADSSPAISEAAATASGDGFDWTDAAIGAGAMLALVAVGLAASGAWRRTDRPRTPAGVAGVG